MTQQIRLSQFVTTYGPGAILEGPEGPRVIPRPDIGIFSDATDLQPASFEISDQRMTQGILGGARIFRLPSNAEVGTTQDRHLYRTKSFPIWSLCLNRGGHAGGHSVLYQGGYNCPVCHTSTPRTQEAIRFIRACSRGHMDDVNWYGMVHGSSDCSHKSWLEWHSGGASLRDIDIRCPECGRKVNLGWAYQRSWPCSGRFPEREPLNRIERKRKTCTVKSRIIQRQASNLRIPELKTLFTIPPRSTKLHNLLQLQPILSVLVALRGVVKKADFEDILLNLHANGMIAERVAREIPRLPWEEVLQAISDVLTPVGNQYSDLIQEEFHAILEASEHGAPPVHGPPPSSETIFEVNPNLTVKASSSTMREFRVVPILRLRTVMAQTGYRREVDTEQPAVQVSVSFPGPIDQTEAWYPGAQFLGEGIFVMLDQDEGWHSDLEGEDVESWKDASGSSEEYPAHVFRGDSREELHPLFVWWHTLSHLLIRSVSINAGYSSASIRERVYLETDGNRARGGVLLYATQPGSEGTLGGLISLAPHFDDTLREAMGLLDSCSGDPLCLENKFTPGSYNGAACYACLLVSETSCEHRNMWLDRRVLAGNVP